MTKTALGPYHGLIVSGVSGVMDPSPNSDSSDYSQSEDGEAEAEGSGP